MFVQCTVCSMTTSMMEYIYIYIYKWWNIYIYIYI